MPLSDVQALTNDPQFLALSDEAKRLALSKRDPSFAKLSQQTQGLIIQKHFPTEKLRSMLGTDPTALIQGIDLRERAKEVGKTTLRVAAPIIGGVAGGATPIPGGAAIGAGLASAGTSYLMGDPTREVVAQGLTGAVLPGPGKTLFRGALKSAGGGILSTTLDSVAKTGELPTKGQVALGGAVGAITGMVGTKLAPKANLTPVLEEVLPKDVAGETSKVLQGGFPKTGPSPDVAEIHKLRLNVQLRGEGGKFLSTKGLRKGGNLLELGKEDLFPAYEPPALPEQPGKIKGFTLSTTPIQRPGWLADHVQSQTGIPIYDDVFRPLKDKLHNGPELEKEVERIRKAYRLDNPGDKSYDTRIKELVGSYTRAALGYHDGTYHSLVAGIKELRKRVPFFGKEMDDATARRWANHLISSPYVTLLPWRAGPAVRVFAHTFQTGYMKVGGANLAKGLARTFTPGGMKEVVRAGAMGPEVFNVPEEVLSVESKGWYGKLVDWGFAGFRFSQDASRATIFHAARYRAQDALKAEPRNFDAFAKKAGLLVGIPKAEIPRFKFLYEQGRTKELLDLAGTVHAWSYIPGHSNLDRPFVSSSTELGRFATQFLNWPSFYGQTLKENFLGEGPKDEKVKMAARWIGANSLLYAVAFKLFGDDPKGRERAAEFTGLGPIFYGGGPGLQQAKEFAGGAQKTFWTGPVAATTDYEEGKKKTVQGFRSMTRAAPVPFRGAYKDLKDLLNP